MAVISIKNKTKSGSLLVGNTPFELGDYESIATVTVGAGGASSIDFTSIPSTYTHLQIRGIAKQTAGTDTQNYFRFNSDSASNYSTHALYTFGGGTVSSLSYLSTYITSGASSNSFCGYVFDILDYANTNKYKTTRALTGYDTNGGGYIWYTSGSWRNTAAITSISITNNGSNNFVQYSTFALYGIKG